MSKISIIGTGAVGASTAFALSKESWVSELVLVDINEQKAQGEALDIAHALAWDQEVCITSGDYAKTAGSEVIIITVGVPEVVGESRLVPLQKNTDILQSIVPEMVKHSPNAKLLVVANPVDLLTYVTYKVSGLPSSQVVGLGTMLDTSRLRYLLGEDFKVATSDINAYVVGEHGDSQVILWDQINIGNISLDKMAKLQNVIFDETYKKEMANNVRQTAFDVWDWKGPNAYCVATAIIRVTKAIVRNERVVLPVSSHQVLDGKDYYISLPSIVGADGNEQIINQDMSEEETKMYNKSSELLVDLIQQIKFEGE
ncbi:MAG: L-lactate dehydrogenase [Erysipelotrichales bacterium]